MKDSKWLRPLFKFNFHWRRFLKVQVALWIFILFRGVDDKIHYAFVLGNFKKVPTHFE